MSGSGVPVILRYGFSILLLFPTIFPLKSSLYTFFSSFSLSLGFSLTYFTFLDFSFGGFGYFGYFGSFGSFGGFGSFSSFGTSIGIGIGGGVGFSTFIGAFLKPINIIFSYFSYFSYFASFFFNFSSSCSSFF